MKIYRDDSLKDRKSNNMRGPMVFFLIMVFFLGEIYALYIHTGAAGVNQKTDDYRQQAILKCNENTIVAGDILDRNGEILVKNTEVKKSGTYADDYAYSQVLGYLQQGGYRFQQMAKSILYQTKEIDDDKGNNIQISIDDGLQKKAAEILAEEIGGTQQKGSAVVLDVKTGEVLAMVSYPSFNANNLEESIPAMDAADPSLEFRYPIAYKNGKVPGSVFKVVTMMAALENGLGEETYLDVSYRVGDYIVKNAYGYGGDSIDLSTALVRSSNCVMSQAALQLGTDKLTEMADKCMLGQTVELDFGNLTSNWDVSDENQEELCQTGFGQGKTLVSTMNMAMITQAIANDGTMLKPYLIQKVLDSEGNCLKDGETEILSQVCSEQTAQTVRTAMYNACQSYKTQIAQDDGVRNILDTYAICAKTGTGENGDSEGTNNAWMITCAPYENPQYVVVINHIQCRQHGINLIRGTAKIYQYLFEEMGRK